VPKSIVRTAKKQLGELEQAQAGRHPQGDLFSAFPSSNTSNTSPVLAFEHTALADAVDDLKPDELSPKDALEAIYRLKKLRDAL